MTKTANFVALKMYRDVQSCNNHIKAGQKGHDEKPSIGLKSLAAKALQQSIKNDQINTEGKNACNFCATQCNSNATNPERELTEKYFISNERNFDKAKENNEISISEIESYYLKHGLSAADLEELKGELKTLSPAEVAKMADMIRERQGKPPETLCDVSIKDLKEFLGEDWYECKNNPELLIKWANLFKDSQLIEQGVVPDSFTAITHCESCSCDVFVPPSLVNNGKVASCMWCRNRAKGLPIPKPTIDTQGQNTHEEQKGNMSFDPLWQEKIVQARQEKIRKYGIKAVCVG